jgi:hypothetical protein
MARRIPSVDIVVDAAALVRNGSGTVSGPIWLRDGDAMAQADFPEVGWIDMPVALLGSWLSELQRLSRTLRSSGYSGSASACRFLDGPYYFTVRPEKGGRWVVRCFEARERSTQAEVPIHEWRTGGAAFLASAVRAARSVLAQCDLQGWWSRDTEVLRRCLESGSQSRIG